MNNPLRGRSVSEALMLGLFLVAGLTWTYVQDARVDRSRDYVEMSLEASGVAVRASETAVRAAGLAQAQEVALPYDRGEWRHWVDEDGDCQDTRQEVLLEESVGPTSTIRNGCRVLEGEWRDPYSDELWTNPAELDIDHLVPLAEAHDSGGWMWTRDDKRAFANDLEHPEHLVATHRRYNRSKGRKDPAEWLPDANVCGYVIAWITVKERYELEYDRPELETLVRELLRCVTQTGTVTLEWEQNP